jgi:SNF2 family DNA or RNA helicase
MGYELAPYQEVSRDYLLATHKGGLTDEQGVGKTAPAIVAAHVRATETGAPALVTVPAYLIPNWVREIKRFAPGATIAIAGGDGAQVRHDALNSNANFVLTAYHTWSTFDGDGKTIPRVPRYPQLTQRRWACMLFDEAHRLRGRNSLWTKRLYKTQNVDSKNRATPIWFFTGTPLVRDPGDAFPLLHVIDKTVFTGYWKFVETFCEVEDTPWDKVVGQVKPGMEEKFWALMSQFFLRRLQKDIPELQGLEEFHHELQVQMPVSVLRTIAKAKKEYVIEHPDLEHSEFVDGGGALYNRLRQMATLPPTADKPKLSALVELLEDLPGRVVVYGWYRDSVYAAAERVGKLQGDRKRATYVITGDVASKRRDNIIQAWAEQPNGALFATIGALQEGANLQAAHQLVFIEETELPAVMDQCVKRLKRRGQEHAVQVWHIRATGTPDIPIRNALEKRSEGIKRAMLEYLLSED